MVDQLNVNNNLPTTTHIIESRNKKRKTEFKLLDTENNFSDFTIGFNHLLYINDGQKNDIVMSITPFDCSTENLEINLTLYACFRTRANQKEYNHYKYYNRWNGLKRSTRDNNLLQDIKRYFDKILDTQPHSYFYTTPLKYKQLRLNASRGCALLLTDENHKPVYYAECISDLEIDFKIDAFNLAKYIDYTDWSSDDDLELTRGELDLFQDNELNTFIDSIDTETEPTHNIRYSNV